MNIPDVPLSPDEVEILFPGATLAFIHQHLQTEKKFGFTDEEIARDYFGDNPAAVFYVVDDILRIILLWSWNNDKLPFDYVWDAAKSKWVTSEYYLK